MKILLKESQLKNLINLLEEQENEDYYEISAEDYLFLMKAASYNPKVTGGKKYKGKPLYIIGDVNLSGTPTKSLGNVIAINGNLDISNTKVADISKINISGSVRDYGSERERIRIRKEEMKKLAEADERKESGEWDLDNPDIDDEGLMANALYQYLVSEEVLNEMDEDTKEEIESLKERIEELVQQGAELDPDSEEREELYNEIDNLQEEIDDLTNDVADVYYIIPKKYGHYEMSMFEVVGHRGKEYAVGTMDDAEKSAVESMKQLLEDTRLEGIDLKRYIDKDQVKDEMREHYESSIRDSPESWFDSDDFQLTEEQEERKEQLENYISEMEDLKTEKEDQRDEYEHNSDEYNELDEQIQEIESNIKTAQDELDSLEPDTEPTEEMIEDKVESLVDSEEPIDYLRNMGADLKYYVDIDEIAEDIADSDGIGIISSYDGEYDEQMVTTSDGQRHRFVVMRIN